MEFKRTSLKNFRFNSNLGKENVLMYLKNIYEKKMEQAKAYDIAIAITPKSNQIVTKIPSNNKILF